MREAWADFLRACGGEPGAPDARFFGESPEHCAALARGESLCLAPLPGRGVLELTGVDARRFLHGQGTCDVEEWPAGRGGSGAVCTPQGRVVANFALAGPNTEHLLLTLPRDTVPGLRDFLQKYIVFSKAEQADASEAFFLLGLFGAGADDAATKVFGSAPGEDECAAVESGVLLRRDALRIECLLGAERVREDWQGLCTAGAVPCGEAAWSLLDIRAGLAEVEGETVASFVPQSLNLDCTGALDLHKGCYTGQEIIIRLQHRGRIKQRAFRLQGSAPACPAPGTPLHAAGQAKPCGTVLRAAPVGEQQWEMLAVLPLNPPPQICLGAADGVLLELLSLPYSTEL